MKVFIIEVSVGREWVMSPSDSCAFRSRDEATKHIKANYSKNKKNHRIKEYIRKEN